MILYHVEKNSIPPAHIRGGNMQQLRLFAGNLPKKSYSCNDFTDNKVRYLASAITKKYIQVNDFNSHKWLVFDIDDVIHTLESITNDCGLPPPTLIVQNPDNLHCHVLYMLENAVHKNKKSSQKALRLLSVIETSFMLQLQADQSYSGLLTKNALHDDWRVIHYAEIQYSMDEMAQFVPDEHFKPIAKNEKQYGVGRNVETFETVLQWSYKAIRQGWPNYDDWHRAVLQRVELVNRKINKPLLDYNEYKHIAKSIARFTHSKFSPQGFSERQAKVGKLGGIAKGKAYKEKRIQALEMLANGTKKKDIANALNVHQNTITNWIKHGK